MQSTNTLWSSLATSVAALSKPARVSLLTLLTLAQLTVLPLLVPANHVPFCSLVLVNLQAFVLLKLSLHHPRPQGLRSPET